MSTKLTLTIEQQVIENAKKYAKSNNRSLSDLIEKYLMTLVSEDEVSTESSPLIKSLKGSFKANGNFDYKLELTKLLANKHLK